MNQTIEQRRAKHAWEKIQAVEKLDRSKKDDFKAEAKNLPTRIITAGLGQAVQFLISKDKATVMVNDLTDWLKKEKMIKQNDLVGEIMNNDSWFLRRATSESLAYLQWYIKFAEAKGLTSKDEE